MSPEPARAVRPPCTASPAPPAGRGVAKRAAMMPAICRRKIKGAFLAQAWPVSALPPARRRVQQSCSQDSNWLRYAIRYRSRIRYPRTSSEDPSSAAKQPAPDPTAPSPNRSEGAEVRQMQSSCAALADRTLPERSARGRAASRPLNRSYSSEELAFSPDRPDAEPRQMPTATQGLPRAPPATRQCPSSWRDNGWRNWGCLE